MICNPAVDDQAKYFRNSLMFTADRFFAKIWSVWMLAVIVAVLMIGVTPKFFAIPALGVVLAMTLWCINCAYRSEH